MLRALGVRDYVIAERLELAPGGGFSVLTGETGAGKSILVDAIELLVGGRGDGTLVREGAERAELTAEFDLAAGGALAAWLAERGLDGDPDRVIVRRALERGGRSRCFVNGHSVTLAQLREAGEFLVDIHGQHEHQSLLRPAAQRALFDAHAGAEALAEDCAAAWRAWRRLEALAAGAREQAARRAAERAELEEQHADLNRLASAAGEWETLSAEQKRLAHGAGLLEGAQAALEALSESEGAAVPRLAAVAVRLRALVEHDSSLGPAIDLLESAGSQAGEALRALRQYASRVDLDPRALAEVEARIETLHAAARRYRVRPSELPALAEDVAGRLAELERSADPERLLAEAAAAAERWRAAAEKLTAERRAAAPGLARLVTRGMRQLGMPGGEFAVALRELAEPSAGGLEEVEFEVSSHPSLPLRPLARVASGGELSRISLAIQLVASKSSGVPTLVFDEIDSGIGGAVADIVGRSLKKLGLERQVLCVTHLPQVAARGDEQWSVQRTAARGRVACDVARLDRGARIDELARMLGGAEITATTRKHAAELLAS